MTKPKRQHSLWTYISNSRWEHPSGWVVSASAWTDYWIATSPDPNIKTRKFPTANAAKAWADKCIGARVDA